MTAIHERLLEDGRRHLVQLVGPNNTGWGRHVSEAVRDLDGALDIYSGHDYNLDDYAQWFRLCSSLQQRVASTGKPVWLDEFGFQNPRYRQMTDYGNYIAQAAAASLNAGNQASFIWLLFDQQYVAPLDTLTNNDSFARGVHRWGTCGWPHDTVAGADRPYPHWYAFALLSRLLGGRPGTQVYQTSGTDDVHIAAVRHPDGNALELPGDQRRPGAPAGERSAERSAEPDPVSLPLRPVGHHAHGRGRADRTVRRLSRRGNRLAGHAAGAGSGRLQHHRRALTGPCHRYEIRVRPRISEAKTPPKHMAANTMKARCMAATKPAGSTASRAVRPRYTVSTIITMPMDSIMPIWRMVPTTALATP